MSPLLGPLVNSNADVVPASPLAQESLPFVFHPRPQRDPLAWEPRLLVGGIYHLAASWLPPHASLSFLQSVAQMPGPFMK